MVDASSLGPDALAEQAERHGILRRLVDELPERKREALRLVHDAQMEIQQAAEELGVPEGTVKSRLYHARKQLARRWQEVEKDNERTREKQ
jgi:RNA polymerase sigma-70 factor (ECF subfamily)